MHVQCQSICDNVCSMYFDTYNDETSVRMDLIMYRTTNCSVLEYSRLYTENTNQQDIK